MLAMKLSSISASFAWAEISDTKAVSRDPVISRYIDTFECLRVGNYVYAALKVTLCEAIRGRRKDQVCVFSQDMVRLSYSGQ